MHSNTTTVCRGKDEKTLALNSTHLPRDLVDKGIHYNYKYFSHLNLKVIGIKCQDSLPKPFNKKAAPPGNSDYYFCQR